MTIERIKELADLIRTMAHTERVFPAGIMADIDNKAIEILAICDEQETVVDLLFNGELPNAVFVEAENEHRKSLSPEMFGAKWFKRDDGFLVLRLHGRLSPTRSARDVAIEAAANHVVEAHRKEEWRSNSPWVSIHGLREALAMPTEDSKT